MAALEPKEHPFSLSDFQQLVSDAFDLPSPKDASHRAHHTPSVPPSRVAFDAARPLSDDNVSRAPSSFSHLRQPLLHRPRTPMDFLKSLRTRASALLRPSSPPPLPMVSHSLDLPSTSRPSTAATARPSLSSQRTTHAQPRPSLSSPVRQSADRDLSRSRTRSLPKSFLPLSKREAPPPLPLKPDNLPSFFDDCTYRSPAYPSRIHTRLPALRKTKSCAPDSSNQPLLVASHPGCIPRPNFVFGSPYDDNEYNIEDPRCPSPFVAPRDAPSPPTLDAHLDVPDYVFARRGSATSTATTSSTKTTSTLAERLSNAFPLSLSFPFVSKTRSKSKLHLSIASSANSSPSTASTVSYGMPVTPITPTFRGPYSFPPSADVIAVGAGCDALPDASRGSFAETEVEALSIGRVLTPDDDPFAKPNIDIGHDVTPKSLAQSSPGERSRHSRCSARGSHRISAPDSDHSLWVRSKPSRVVSIPVGSRRPTIPDETRDLLSSSFSFPSSSSVHSEGFSSEESFVALNPTGATEVSHPPSAWSPYSTPLSHHQSLSEDRLHSEVEVTDFPLPPMTFAGVSIAVRPNPPPHRPLPSLPTVDTDKPSVGNPSEHFEGVIAEASRTYHSEAPQYEDVLPVLRRLGERPPSPFPLGRREQETSFRTGSFSSSCLDDSDVLGEQSLTGLGLRCPQPMLTSSHWKTSATDDFVYSQDPRVNYSVDQNLEDILDELLTENALTDFDNTILHTSEPEQQMSAVVKSYSPESEPDSWDRGTSRSTAFFSARSSTFSLNSLPETTSTSWRTENFLMAPEV
ncbi:hypothetical protein K474DRAFT_1706393 [Panus rudis PR-1116 ss-1]|nr:hypothetical protein K474DRAFT_1706393 [Panus rudis PR-1116 ss-1]